MKKLFKKLALMVVALLTFSVGSNYTVKEVKAAENEIIFNLGADGEAKHSDNNSAKTTYSETVDEYSLNITKGNKMYPGSRDDKGNSCIKMGTGKAAGSFTISNIPDDVTNVIIDVAGYKANTASVKINNSTIALTKKSNNGEYDSITVAPSSTKTVDFTVSSGNRCMINTITYVISSSGGSSEPDTSPKLSIQGTANAQVGTELNLETKSSNLTEKITWTSSDDSIATVVNGVVTPLSMGKTTITASADGLTSKCDVTVYLSSSTELTVSEALSVCEFVGNVNTPYQYSVKGTIKSIDSAYSEQYENITLTLSDETGSITVYRMKGGKDLAEGDLITVTGYLINYTKENVVTPEFAIGSTYVLHEKPEVTDLRNELNKINAYMSLAYSYKATTTTEEVEVQTNIEDVLTRETTTVPKGTTYKDWKDITVNSSASYSGNSAGDKESIQLRSDNNNSGIVTTASGGKAIMVKVVWNGDTTNGRTLDIYGKNTAYSAATDLYNDSTKGTKLGSLEKGETELKITGDYEYIGLRSASGAMYLTSISIEWKTGAASGETETKEVTTLSDSQFFIRCGVDVALSSIEGVDEYGIKVTANGKEMFYNNESLSWGTESNADNPYHYVVISLGDIINDLDKLKTEFTVVAYVKYEGKVYCSTEDKSYSVVSMVEKYHKDGYEEVDHLYNYFNK